jgi:DUF4097 and DUF4098 domain-containing protein YvlB
MQISEEKINDILQDMEEMISSAKEEGISDDDLIKKFGEPTKLAQDLAEYEKRVDKETDTSEDDTHYAYEPQSDHLSIKIKLTSDDVVFHVVDSAQIRVIIQDSKNAEEHHVTYENNLLTIESTSKISTFFGFSFGSSSSRNIIIEIPKHVNIDDLKYDVVNGDLELSNLEIDKFKINTTEGDMEINHIKFMDGQIHTVNGDIHMTSAKGLTLNVNTVSGDIEVDSSKVENDLTIHTVSGDVAANNTEANTLYFHTVSGDVDGKEFYIKKLYFESVSGDVNIKNERKEYIEVMQKKTLSGDVNI